MSKQMYIRGIVATAIVLFQVTSANALQPLIGIPSPNFGIDDTHFMYAGQNGYSDAGDGPYTHYVDNNAGCTDSGNPNGSAANPRCSVPNTLAAGSVVEVHGGPYSEMPLSFSGTASQPIFLRGPTGGKIVFQGREGLEISGQYFVIENVDINRVQNSADFYAMRDSNIHEPNPSTGGMISGGGHDVVYLRNHIWGNCERVSGLECTDPGGLNHDTDRHGFNIDGSAYNWWILENEIHHNGGDGIQFCHSCVSSGNGGPGAIYIANNVIYGDKENAIDLKEFTGPVIISGNDMSDYFRITSGQGEAIRINDEGDQGEVWIIRNTIHDSNICIGPDDSDAESYAVDNICDRNNNGILSGLTGRAGNLTNGVSDGDPNALYDLFQSRYGISIRPGAVNNVKPEPPTNLTVN